MAVMTKQYTSKPIYCPSHVCWLFLNFHWHEGLGPFFKGRKIVCNCAYERNSSIIRLFLTTTVCTPVSWHPMDIEFFFKIYSHKELFAVLSKSS